MESLITAFIAGFMVGKPNTIETVKLAKTSFYNYYKNSRMWINLEPHFNTVFDRALRSIEKKLEELNDLKFN